MSRSFVAIYVFNFSRCNKNTEWQQQQIVTILIEAGGDVDQASNIGYIPLGRSCQCGRLEIVRLLLQQPNIDANKGPEGWSPLALAKPDKHTEIIQLLTTAGAINKK